MRLTSRNKPNKKTNKQTNKQTNVSFEKRSCLMRCKTKQNNKKLKKEKYEKGLRNWTNNSSDDIMTLQHNENEKWG